MSKKNTCQKQKPNDEYQNLRKDHRKKTPKHVVTFEIDATPDVIGQLPTTEVVGLRLRR